MELAPSCRGAHLLKGKELRMALFRGLSPQVNFPAQEEAVLRFWREQEVFRKSQEARARAPRYVFYEGPPTANGAPHPGHVLTRVIKDLFPRYRTMAGYYVGRKAGWDTHGLPVEIEVEKELGLGSKQDIERYGVESFVEKCRQSVWKYIGEWEKLTERIGFWLDLQTPYVTYTREYTESVWWGLSEIWKKGLLYHGHKVVPYCPRCGTALSSHEVAQGYEEVEDPSVFLRFRCRGEEKTSFLAWTTTPWTLLSNAALAVGPDFDYAYVRLKDEVLILAAALVDRVFPQEKVEMLKTVSGKDLLGREYEPLYRYARFQERAHYVLGADFVSLSEGTGLVHVAPAYGEEDYRAGQVNALPVIQMVDERGFVKNEVSPWAGLYFKEADPEILRDLHRRGLLLRQGRYRHNYPFCWRCNAPLIYYARASWFIRTTQLKRELLENNRQVNWVPAHIGEGRFGDFLENNVDWAISRERYWGTPLNIWVCEGCSYQEALASLQELRSRNPELPENLELHKPHIDRASYPCPRCQRAMKRVSEVVDCWFDSGAMFFAQWGYPARGQEDFANNYPADFISEAIDQTRGWFYSLLAVSTLLFGGKPPPHPYRSCLVLGHVCDAQGVKMSKSKGNYLDPWEILNSAGADALRWYFYSAVPIGSSMRFSRQAVANAQKEFILKLWNVYSFLVIYARLDGFDPENTVRRAPSERSLLDRWMLSELHLTLARARKKLELYDPYGAARSLADFVEALSNWYVRRARNRFWKSTRDADKWDAYWTLYEVLTTLAKMLAPFLPFLAEELYQNLVRSANPANSRESVHMEDYPRPDVSLTDRELAARMDVLREVVSMGHAARASARLKVRQPLREAVVFLARGEEEPGLVSLRALAAEELNVKALRVSQEREKYVSHRTVPNFKNLGPRYGARTPQIQEALGKLSPEAARVELSLKGNLRLTLPGGEAVLMPEDVEFRLVAQEGYAAAESPRAVVVLDTSITPELREEGLARDLVHEIQNQRKKMSLAYEARIDSGIGLPADSELAGVLQRHESYIRNETLSVKLVVHTAQPGEAGARVKLGGEEITLSIQPLA